MIICQYSGSRWYTDAIFSSIRPIQLIGWRRSMRAVSMQWMAWINSGRSSTPRGWSWTGRSRASRMTMVCWAARTRNYRWRLMSWSRTSNFRKRPSLTPPCSITSSWVSSRQRTQSSHPLLTRSGRREKRWTWRWTLCGAVSARRQASWRSRRPLAASWNGQFHLLSSPVPDLARSCAGGLVRFCWRLGHFGEIIGNRKVPIIFKTP